MNSPFQFSIVLLLLVVMCVGVVWLQIFLSKRQSRWLGLVLPCICLILSLVVVLGMEAFTAGSRVQEFYENGQLIQRVAEPLVPNAQNGMGGHVLAILMVFLVGNIPTICLVAIYFACREKMRREASLAKMNVQDLE